jgi:TonB family protein
MRKSVVITLAAAICINAAPASEKTILRLKPSTPWVVDYADDSCRLARTFGEGPQQVTLFLDQFEPAAGFYVILGGGPFGARRDVVDIDLTLRFGPNEAVQEVSSVTGTLGKQPAVIVAGPQRIAPLSKEETESRDTIKKSGARYDVPVIPREREAAVRFLEIKGTTSDIVLETGPMDKPLGILRECAWDTVGDWGLDVAQQQKLQRGPVAKDGAQGWFVADDYPSNMVKGNYQGTVNYRLIVDENGKPKSCHVQRSTRPKDFDLTVCRVVMKRGKFQPALDAAGKPVASFWSQAITFRLEGR